MDAAVVGSSRNALAGAASRVGLGVIFLCAVIDQVVLLCSEPRVRHAEFIQTLISNRVGLPAELKHINKRRKRN